MWTLALALGGTLYSAYLRYFEFLSYLELLVNEAICAWCVVSAALVTAILLPSVREPRESR